MPSYYHAQATGLVLLPVYDECEQHIRALWPVWTTAVASVTSGKLKNSLVDSASRAGVWASLSFVLCGKPCGIRAVGLRSLRECAYHCGGDSCQQLPRDCASAGFGPTGPRCAVAQIRYQSGQNGGGNAQAHPETSVSCMYGFAGATGHAGRQ
jgi:hypothetical protein